MRGTAGRPIGIAHIAFDYTIKRRFTERVRDLKTRCPAEHDRFTRARHVLYALRFYRIPSHRCNGPVPFRIDLLARPTLDDPPPLPSLRTAATRAIDRRLLFLRRVLPRSSAVLPRAGLQNDFQSHSLRRLQSVDLLRPRLLPVSIIAPQRLSRIITVRSHCAARCSDVQRITISSAAVVIDLVPSSSAQPSFHIGN